MNREEKKEIEVISSGNERRESELLHPKEEEEEKKLTRVSYFQLQYKFANKKDMILLVFAVLGSLIAGLSMPFIALLLGNAINNFGPGIEEQGPDKLNEAVSKLAVIYMLVGLGIFLGSFMMVFFWTCVGKRLINKINEEYLRVIMKQEQGWFEKSNPYEFATKMQSQIKTIENGVKFFLNHLDR
jgi:ATP-binding cassette subfamily B (MDR/TAP) protein 1